MATVTFVEPTIRTEAASVLQLTSLLVLAKVYVFFCIVHERKRLELVQHGGTDKDRRHSFTAESFLFLECRGGALLASFVLLNNRGIRQSTRFRNRHRIS